MKKGLSRREFLERSAGATGALAASPRIFLEPEHIPLPLQSPSPSDRVRFGIIGIGMQGSGLLTNAVQLPGVECVAAADRSEEHTSELQSRLHLVCRLLLEKKKRPTDYWVTLERGLDSPTERANERHTA